MEAAERRQQRDAQRRLRELDRQAKERAKLSALEQAHLEVATYENQVDVLLSVHKEQSQAWDWTAFASSLPPPVPVQNSHREYEAKLQMMVLPSPQKEGFEATVEQARLQDKQSYQEAVQDYSKERAEWERMSSLSLRILAGEYSAYIEALRDLSPISEISELGSSLHFTVHTAKLIECVLKANGSQVIPSEVKTLTASGKVSTKPMPKGRFHEIYQDYLSACVLRIAREVFALLPVETLLVTASANVFDPRTGQTEERSVLSVAVPRAAIVHLNFEKLVPSDAIESFLHRGDFKASRKSESFQSIVPLTPADTVRTAVDDMGFRDLLDSVQKMREDITSRIAELSQRLSATSSQNGPSA
jgi:hypothetical protein